MTHDPFAPPPGRATAMPRFVRLDPRTAAVRVAAAARRPSVRAPADLPADLLPGHQAERPVDLASDRDAESATQSWEVEVLAVAAPPFVERRRGVRGALTGVLSVTRCAWRVVERRARRHD